MALKLGITASNVHALARRGELPYYDLGGTRRYKLSEVRQAIAGLHRPVRNGKPRSVS